MGSRRIVKYKADVIDSIRSDWTISDDGNDYGPTDSWPAPFLGVDDGSNRAALSTLRRGGTRDGVRFDGGPNGSKSYNLIPRQVRGPISFHDGGINKLLRGGAPTALARDAFHEQRREDALFSRTGFDGDAYAFLRRQDPGADMTYAPRRGPIFPTSTSSTMAGAGDFGFDDAAHITDDVHTWHLRMLEILRQYGVKIDAQADKAIGAAFFAMSNAANTSNAAQSVADAHAVTLREVRRILRGEPSKPLFDLILLHAQNMQKLIPGGGGFFRDLGSAVSTVGKGLGSVATAAYSVGKGAVNVVGGAANIVGKLALSPVRLATDIAQGKNVLKAFSDTVKRDLQSAKELAPYAQAVLSVVPGVGQGVNAAIAAGAALAQGQNITDALVQGVKGMVPGGPLAQKALETAYNVAKGQSITDAALNVLRDQVPAGPARTAFDTGVALAHGKNLQDVAKEQGMALISSTVQTLSPLKQSPMSNVGPTIGKIAQTAVQILPGNVKQVASALLQNPALRSLPISEVARRMNVTESVARDAVASVMQAAQRTGMGQAVKALASAPEIAQRIGTGTSFDQALSSFGSRAAPNVFTPNAVRPVLATFRNPMSVAHQLRSGNPVVLPRLARLMPGGAMGLHDAGAFATIRQGSTGPDVQAWQKIIGVTADGKFGPGTDAATRSWQRAHGLTADGVVGPMTWAAATGSGASPSTLSTGPTSPGTMTIPEVVIAAAPPPPLTGTQIAAAQSMPTIRLGSSGKAVETWQGILRRDSGISGFSLPPDGQFGAITDAATRKWQNSSGLAADGVVGPKTWMKAIGSLTTAPLPAEKAPGVALPTPVPPNLPPGLPPIPTQPAAPPASVPVAVLPPPITGMTPQPVVVSPIPGVAPVVIAKDPTPILPTVPQTKDEKAGNAVAALAVGALAAKLFGIF